MVSNKGMGVVLVMAHLVITLAILGVYAYSIFTGHPDATSQNLLVAIVGYWFGALGFSGISNLTKGSDATQAVQPLAPVQPNGGEKQNG